MRRIVLAALAATTLLSGAALAQQTPNGNSAGGPARIGTPGQIVPEERTYIRGYVARESVAPVVVQGAMAPGYVVPATVPLLAFPETVFAQAPSVRPYRYFSTGRQVVLVDPVTRQVVEVLD